jgi:hypothetical protein
MAPSSSTALIHAASSGDLDIVQDLARLGTRVDAMGCEALCRAAEAGHLEVVRYLHQNGCDLAAVGDVALQRAAISGHVHVVRYLHQNGSPLSLCTPALLRRLAAADTVGTLVYLHQNGCPIDPALCRDLLHAAARTDASGAFLYLGSTNIDPDWGGKRGIEIAAASGSDKVLQCLEAHRPSAALRDARGATRPPLVGKPLVFQHLAKTAGTTLNKVFTHVFAAWERVDSLSRTSVTAIATTTDEAVRAALRLAMAERGSSAIRFVGGHVGSGFVDELPAGTRFATVLRDPVERVISAFEYVKRRGLVSDIPPDMDIADYLLSRDHLHLWMADAQVRVLAGGELNPVCPVEATSALTRPVTEEDVDAVWTRFETEFELVGLTEHLDECLVMLSEAFGCPLSDLVYTSENITSDRTRTDSLPAEAIDRIRATNAFDQRLYDRTKEAFFKAFAQGGEARQERLGRFRALNAHYRQGASRRTLRHLEKHAYR